MDKTLDNSIAAIQRQIDVLEYIIYENAKKISLLKTSKEVRLVCQVHSEIEGKVYTQNYYHYS